MNTAIIFDTETTGLPDWNNPSEAEHQPHLVQLAAHQVNLETFQILQSIDVIIKPESWDIPQETIDVHGITKEYAMDVGISERLAVEMFIELWGGRNRVAFNTTFDNRIMRIATKRYSPEHIVESWKEGPYECAMIASRKIIGGKQPTLAEAYEYFIGKKLENAHSAIADCNACLEVYKAIKSQN